TCFRGVILGFALPAREPRKHGTRHPLVRAGSVSDVKVWIIVAHASGSELGEALLGIAPPPRTLTTDNQPRTTDNPHESRHCRLRQEHGVSLADGRSARCGQGASRPDRRRRSARRAARLALRAVQAEEGRDLRQAGVSRYTGADALGTAR